VKVQRRCGVRSGSRTEELNVSTTSPLSLRKRLSKCGYDRVGPLPDEPERSVDAFRPPFFELLTRDFFKLTDGKQILNRAVYERRAFVTVPLLQCNAVASDAPISKYVDSSQHCVC